jgi:hypothetical protein
MNVSWTHQQGNARTGSLPTGVNYRQGVPTMCLGISSSARETRGAYGTTLRQTGCVEQAASAHIFFPVLAAFTAIGMPEPRLHDQTRATMAAGDRP